MTKLTGPLLSLLFLGSTVSGALAAGCPAEGPALQVLGSGDRHLSANRAGPAFAIWQGNRARYLIDAGPGSSLRMGQADIRTQDIRALLLTNNNAIHTAALPELVLHAQSAGRKTPLPIYGPGGYKGSPSTVALIRALFEISRGAYRQLGEALTPLDKFGFKLQPHNIPVKFKQGKPVLPKQEEALEAFQHGNVRAMASPVEHGDAPTLAWRLDFGNQGIVIAGDSAAPGNRLQDLAKGASMLVIPHAITVAGRGDTDGHASPERIGQIAHAAGVSQLVLVHRHPATEGQEQDTANIIGKRYTGKVVFANDLDCLPF